MHAFRSTVHTIAFIVLTILNLPEPISLGTLIASFLKLIYDTCNTYPTSGKWIILSLCVIQLIQFMLSQFTDPGSPIRKTMVLHCAMLSARVLVDVKYGMMNI